MAAIDKERIIPSSRTRAVFPGALGPGWAGPLVGVPIPPLLTRILRYILYQFLTGIGRISDAMW